MRDNRLNKEFKKFTANQSGETAIQATLIFSAAVMLGVIIGVPMLNDATKEYAHQKQFGIDTITTSSVSSSKKDTKSERHTVRKTIFDTLDDKGNVKIK